MSEVATVHPDIRAAFRQALLGIPGLPTVWAWEGERFTPENGTAWIRERMRPLSSERRGLGQGGQTAHHVVCEATPFFPSGKGTLAVEQAAGLVMARFLEGTPLLYGQTKARVMQIERAPAVHEPDWVSVPVKATLLAFTAS